MVRLEPRRRVILECKSHGRDAFDTRRNIGWWIQPLGLSPIGPQSKIIFPDIAPGINSHRSTATNARLLVHLVLGFVHAVEPLMPVLVPNYDSIDARYITFHPYTKLPLTSFHHLARFTMHVEGAISTGIF